jgi:hypothetical protein
MVERWFGDIPRGPEVVLQPAAPVTLAAPVREETVDQVPITRMEIRYRRAVLADTEIRVTARLRRPQVARLVLDYEVRDDAGDLLASAETEQVVVNAGGELLLTLPADLQTLVASMLAWQDGETPAAAERSRTSVNT